MDGTLANFFLRPLLDCLRGSTPYGDHLTYCYDFSSKMFHFETILKSFWGPKRSCGPIPGSWDQSGDQGALKAKIPPFFHPLFWDLFWTSFRFGVKICRKSIKKSRVCAQCNFWTIFDRFWGHFWRSKMASSIVNSSRIAFWTFCEKSKIRCSFGGPFWRLLGSWIAHYTPPRRSEARKLRRWQLRQF